MQKKKGWVCKRMALVLVATCIVLSPLLSQAEIYRWTDENGKVHFSDKPVGDKAKKLDIKEQPEAPVDEQTREQRKRKVDQYLRARQEERAELDKQDEEKKRLKKVRKEKCSEFTHRYREIIEAGAVYFRNKDGTRDYLGDERRAKEEARLKAEVKKWCK